MANGFNASRAVRIFEIISDFRELQISIRQTQIGSDNSDSSLLGYEIYEECIREAGSILALPYINESQMDIEEEGDGEIQKLQLQSILLDASVRRFRCQKCYFLVLAVERWENGRLELLQGQEPQLEHQAELAMLDSILQTEVDAITAEYVETFLNARDEADDRWMDEDPSLEMILQEI